MDKLLILIRHGKAQSRDLGIVDFERELTGAGKRSLKAWLPKSRRLVAAEPVSSFELWASPAARTMQTAEVVSAVWGARLEGFPSRPQQVEALWHGDVSALLDAFEDSQGDAVIMCGHNPTIEELCYQLCGCDIAFATGAVAALRVSCGASSPNARLLWFVQGPESRNWKRS